MQELLEARLGIQEEGHWTSEWCSFLWDSSILIMHLVRPLEPFLQILHSGSAHIHHWIFAPYLQLLCIMQCLRDFFEQISVLFGPSSYIFHKYSWPTSDQITRHASCELALCIFRCQASLSMLAVVFEHGTIASHTVWAFNIECKPNGKKGFTWLVHSMLNIDVL